MEPEVAKSKFFKGLKRTLNRLYYARRGAVYRVQFSRYTGITSVLVNPKANKVYHSNKTDLSDRIQNALMGHYTSESKPEDLIDDALYEYNDVHITKIEMNETARQNLIKEAIGVLEYE